MTRRVHAIVCLLLPLVLIGVSHIGPSLIIGPLGHHLS